MIFLGAGASSQFGIPTTTKFTEEIEKILSNGNKRLLKAFQEHHTIINNEKPNFEHILTLLRAATYPNEVPSNDYTVSFLASNQQYKKDYSKIIDQMYDVVCDYCSAPFNPKHKHYLESDRLEEKFEYTYDPLLGVTLQHRNQELVISTNYDPSLEIWAQRRNVRLHDGTKQTNNPEINKIISKQDHFDQITHRQGNQGLYLLRMHGSIWERQGDFNIKFTRPKSSLYHSDLYAKFRDSRPYLIFPGQESEVFRGNWYNNYQFFRDKLEGQCLFIGYSFSHPALRNAVIDALNDNQITLSILSRKPSTIADKLDPDKKHRAEKRIITLEGSFGQKSGVQAIMQWLGKTNTSRHPDWVHLHSDGKIWKNGVTIEMLN